MMKATLPQIQEYHHSEKDPEAKSFLELTYRAEGFIPTPVNEMLPVHYQELIETPSTIAGSVENSEVVSLSIETHTAAHNMKNVARVVIVNDKGQRVLDTLVKPQTKEIALKPGLKSQLFKLSELRAESLEDVKERVLRLIKGKKLVGYHLPQKIQDLGLLEERVTAAGAQESNQTPKAQSGPLVPNPLQEREGTQFQVQSKTEKKKLALQVSEAYDMAKVFNAQLSCQQQPMSLLCEKYLNLNYKKRPQPAFAFSEAKLSMALFKQWEVLNKSVQEESQATTSPRESGFTKEKSSSNMKKGKGSSDKKNRVESHALSDSTNSEKKQGTTIIKPIYPVIPQATHQDEKQTSSNGGEDLVTLTGAQLKCLIKDFAKQSIRDQLAKVLSQLNGQDDE